jgi:quercetin dioxygenase-like cupin family protein
MHVRSSELELLDNDVRRAGGAVRYLEGAAYGLKTSVYHSQVPPGAGPRTHSHPYAEVFVLHEGQGRYTVEDETFEAAAGDIVIIPAGMWHSFVNPGEGFLRQTAIHEAPVHAATRRDDP